MKFTIEVNDFWLDEESDIEPALKAYIIHDVIVKITKSIEEQAKAEISNKVDEMIKSRLSSIIDNKLIELVETGIIKVSGKDIAIKEHIKNVFESSHGWGNPTEQIKKFAKVFGEQMKVQYNAVFANQIVVSMKEQGFLKDEVVNLLLTEDKK